ncbi:MAG TPA: hypothetical protein VJB57_00310 [Dehalococcoidia bacterium]|nr:hypothetical protein [Dehalococcoidia bacterium]
MLASAKILAVVTHTSTGGLSDSDLKMLRGLVLRRRSEEAQRWLQRQGFNSARARQVVLEQEMAVSNLIYLAPLRDFAIGGLLFFLGVVAFGLVGNDPAAPDGLREGTSWGPYSLLIVFAVLAGLFALRGLWALLRYRLALIRHPIRKDPFGEFGS